MQYVPSLCKALHWIPSTEREKEKKEIPTYFNTSEPMLSEISQKKMEQILYHST
jgi:predicted nucleic acid binding AN1-type Zn finger protein